MLGMVRLFRGITLSVFEWPAFVFSFPKMDEFGFDVESEQDRAEVGMGAG